VKTWFAVSSLHRKLCAIQFLSSWEFMIKSLICSDFIKKHRYENNIFPTPYNITLSILQKSIVVNKNSYLCQTTYHWNFASLLLVVWSRANNNISEDQCPYE
jgi:hypothetical protein